MKKGIIKKLLLLSLCLSFIISFYGIESLGSTGAKLDQLYLSDVKERWTDFHVLNDGEDLISANKNLIGGNLKIGSIEYPKGISMHCAADNPSYLEIDLSGLDYQFFSAKVGMQSYAAGVFLDWASASFRILLDGVEVAKTDVLNFGEEAMDISIDISGASVLRLETDNAGSHACDWTVWANTKLYNAQSYETDDLYIGDAKDKWTNYNVYDEMISANKNLNGGKLEINDVEYDKGISMHCTPNEPTYLEFDLTGLNYRTFCAEVGMQSYADGVFLDWGDASFRILADGVEVAKTDVLKFGDDAVFIAAEINCANTLRLEAYNNGSISCDWTVWANSKVSSKTVSELEEEYKNRGKEDMEPQDPDTVKGEKAYISDLIWHKETAYNDLFTRDELVSGEIIYMDGNFFEKGICLHAMSNKVPAFVELNIENLGYTTFASYIGIPESLRHDITMASVVFIVYADGVEVARSTHIYGDGAEKLSVDITGVSVLKLAVISSDTNISGDWGTWANVLISKNSDPGYVFSIEEPEWNGGSLI